jgi:TPR repeat protein
MAGSLALLCALVACGTEAGGEAGAPADRAPQAAQPGVPSGGQVIPMDNPEELVPDCEAGDGPSCFNLGLLHLTGQGVEASLEAAIARFKRACELGIERGCVNVGVLSAQAAEAGAAADADAAAAAACWAGEAGACLTIGRLRSKEGAYDEAAAWLERGCAAGGGLPCTDLGVAYYAGRGVEKDPASALKYFKKGCAGGDPAGCVNTARMYFVGEGVEANPRMAAQYLTTACQGGSQEACQRLAQVRAAMDGAPAATPTAAPDGPAPAGAQ